MLRDVRPTDVPRVMQFLRNEFPEEEAILGTRPEGIEKIVRRIFRWDARFFLGLLRVLGRPVYRFFVIENGGRIVATTLLNFPAGAGYVSMVVVDPTERRRGYARRLLEEARRATERRGRPFVVLDVLESNAPARALYERMGYRELRATGYLVLDLSGAAPDPAPSVPGIRPFRKSDAPALAAIAQRNAPPEVARILPVKPRDLIGSNWVGQMMSTVTAAWVIDRGQGPEAHISASSTPVTEAGHLSSPVVAESADPAAVAALVRTAVAWIAERKAPRAVSMVPEANGRGRAALEAAGFHHAIAILTLYRPSA
jgi:ribosomal protein S18 acetylase RimI-like enzyme